MMGFRIFSAFILGLVLSGCVLTNPEFKSAQGRFQYTSPPNHVVGNNELNKAIEYALKTQEDFDDWQGELTSLNNVEIWSLFTLGTASGTAAAYGAPKDVIVGLGIGVAALLGAGEIANLDKRSLIIVNGHKAIQCSIDTALEMNAVSNKLRSAKSTFPQLAFKTLRPTLTMGFVGKSANSILASSQGATLAEIQSVASFFGVKKLSERANRKLSDAQQNLTTAMTNAETKAMAAASALDKTVTAIRYTVRRQVRKNKIDKGQIFKNQRNLISERAKEIVAELEAAKKKADEAEVVAGDVMGDSEAQKLLGEQGIFSVLEANVKKVADKGKDVISVAELLKSQLECTAVESP